MLRFAAASIGRAALTSFSILLIYRFLAGVLAKGGTQSLWTVVGTLLLAQLGAAALGYDARLSEQRLVTVIELGTMSRLIRHILSLSAGFFDGRTHGDLVQSVRRMTNPSGNHGVGQLLFESGRPRPHEWPWSQPSLAVGAFAHPGGGRP